MWRVIIAIIERYCYANGVGLIRRWMASCTIPPGYCKFLQHTRLYEDTFLAQRICLHAAYRQILQIQHARITDPIE